MANVTLQELTKSFDKVVAVNRINLEIPDKEFVVFVGPSGCGKTTTLRMIAGLEEVSEGTIMISDRIVNDIPPKDRNIAMVFQNYALYPHMNVYKNMAFGLKLRRTPKPEIDRRVREASRILGIEELLDRKPRQLSGGQRQRVAVGRAIVRQPQVFLFDEPLSNLDAKLRVQMRRDLAALRRRLGTTTIYVTHDQVEAMTLGDRIVVMNAGKVQQEGAPLEIYRRPANTFVAAFLGSPPMNQLPGRLVRHDGRWFEAGTGFRLPVAGAPFPPGGAPERPVVLGIRPEDIRPTTDPSGFEAVVSEIEPLGHEVLVTVEAGGVTLIL